MHGKKMSPQMTMSAQPAWGWHVDTMNSHLKREATVAQYPQLRAGAGCAKYAKEGS